MARTALSNRIFNIYTEKKFLNFNFFEIFQNFRFVQI